MESSHSSSLNPLAEVRDYNSMLTRICFFTILTSGFATWLLRGSYPSLDRVLGKLDFRVDLTFVKDVKILGTLLPAVAVGLIARAFKLHDRISDIFRIR